MVGGNDALDALVVTDDVARGNGRIVAESVNRTRGIRVADWNDQGYRGNPGIATASNLWHMREGRCFMFFRRR